MIRKAIIATSCVLFFGHANAQTPFGVDDIVNSKNPLAASVTTWSNGYCSLLASTTKQIVGKDRTPAPMSVGTLFVPKRGTGDTVDVDVNGAFCPATKLWLGETTPADNTDKHAVTYTVGFQLAVKLKAGEFLNLIDVDLTDIDTIGVRMENARLILAGQDRQEGVTSITLGGQFCGAAKPNQIDRVQLITSNCVGRVEARLKSKKNLTISAFDFKFAGLLSGLDVGLSGSWKREIQGGIKACAQGTASAAAPKPADPKPATPKPAGEKKDDTAEKAPNTDAVVNFTVAGKPIKISISGNDEVKLTLGNDQTATSSTKTTKPAGTGSSTTTGGVTDNNTAPKPAKTENVDIDKDCADDIIYTTTDDVLFGIGYIPAKKHILNALAAQKK